MSFGTDLSSAYGFDSGLGMGSMSGGNSYDSQAAAAARRSSPPMSPVNTGYQTQPSSSQSQPSHASPPVMQPNQDQVRYENDMKLLQQEMYKYQSQSQNQTQTQTQSYASNQPSLFDAMWNKRKELIKLLTLSLLIVIALSFHSVMEHVIKSYIAENDMTAKNEVMLRFLYPAVMILLVWFIKAASSK